MILLHNEIKIHIYYLTRCRHIHEAVFQHSFTLIINWSSSVTQGNSKEWFSAVSKEKRSTKTLKLWHLKVFKGLRYQSQRLFTLQFFPSKVIENQTREEEEEEEEEEKE